ncbi:NUDIX hydrolase [Halovivax limisalsi]|uniref:NUDIX hydrolase n=1 Tax=Halovivax limisalsi TaxID=1453760 RepID=UPI001FFC3BA5|nr:NUDIX domain-containing protein [Halovivax limisalsi]
MSDIQCKVLGLVRRDDEYLVQHLTDPGASGFYRPIGGGVEFGESSDEALAREFREELGIDLEVGQPVGTIENRFTWNGDADHEFVICRNATFVDDALYDRERFDGIDDGGRIEYEATWRTLDDLADGPEPLYPEGLEGLLRGHLGDGVGHVDDR